MYHCDLVKAQDLSPSDQGLWREMCQLSPALSSPILSYDFTQMVARVREDVYVAIIKKGSEVLGFWPHHRRPNAFARPPGAPFSDYTAMICAPDFPLKISAVMALAQIDQFQAIGIIDPYGVFDEIEGEIDEAYGIDLGQAETTNQVNKKQTKNINRLRRHLSEAHGEVHFLFPDDDEAHYQAMLRFKRDQIKRTGLHDFLSPPWVQAFMAELRAAPKSGLHGTMLTLMAGETACCFHFGVQLKDRMHPWISTYDPALSAFSPGQIFLTDCHAPLKDKGIIYYDLSTGQTHYKASFCNTHFKVRHAKIFSDSPKAKAKAVEASNIAAFVHKLSPKASHALERLERRMDHIACLELKSTDRLKGLALALGAFQKRLKPQSGG